MSISTPLSETIQRQNPDQSAAPPTTTSPSQHESPAVTTTEPSSPKPRTPLALPPSSTNTTQLDLSQGSTSIKLDHLGPMIVNVDGTLGRISNWGEMAEIEKRNTLRIIAKRNKERLDVLKRPEGEEGMGVGGEKEGKEGMREGA